MNKTANKEYIQYYKFYLESLAKSKQEALRKMLIAGQVCPMKTNPTTGLPLDNKEIDNIDFVLDCILNSTKALRLIQRAECFEEYKYSMYFKFKTNQEINWRELNSELFLDENQIEFLNNENEIEKSQFFFLNEKVFFKFSFKLELYLSKYYINLFTKASFICIMDLNKEELEIRFNGLVTPFKTTTNYYISFIDKIVKFLETGLNIAISPLDFSFLTIKDNREKIKKTHHIVLTDTDFDDDGGASLRSNGDNKRPYVDEIEELFQIKEKELGEEVTLAEKNMFNFLKREVMDFLRNKEDEARYKKIIIKFGSEGYQTNFTYIYGINACNCIIHHEYLKLKEEGRLDSVRDIIFELEEKFNKSGNCRE